jgi:hypothetical protein
MNRTLFASLLASTSLFTFAACGGDGGSSTPSEYDADFKNAEDNNLARAILAGLGVDSMLAVATVTGYAAFGDAPTGVSCPSFARNGDEVTVTGGCTMDDGTKLEGSLVFSNVKPIFGGGDFDPSKPSTMSFDGFEIQDEGGTFTYDGTITIEPSGKQIVDLTASFDGITAHSKLERTCTAEGACTTAAGAWIDVDGVGAAGVEGTWTLAGQTHAGSMTLRGAQVLDVDLGAATSNDDCIPYAIDGVDQEPLCLQ